MTDNASFVLINGNRYSSASVVAHLIVDGAANVRLWGLEKITYKDKLEPTDVIGDGGQLLGTTFGSYSTEGSWTLHRRMFLAVQAALANSGEAMDPQQPPGGVRFNIVLSFKAEEPGGETQTDRLEGCRMIERGSGVDNTTADPQKFEGALKISRIAVAGKYLDQIAAAA